MFGVESAAKYGQRDAGVLQPALYVSNDQIHIADKPGASNPVDDPIKIEPDDQLTTIRQFGNATEDIRFGKRPDQEMCNLYLMYHLGRKTRRDLSSTSTL